jgi:hypothetical protein
MLGRQSFNRGETAWTQIDINDNSRKKRSFYLVSSHVPVNGLGNPAMIRLAMQAMKASRTSKKMSSFDAVMPIGQL